MSFDRVCGRGVCVPVPHTTRRKPADANVGLAPRIHWTILFFAQRPARRDPLPPALG
jgi:hypothetical protein